MPLHSFKSRAALMCLLILYMTFGCFAARLREHFCAFDHINKDRNGDLLDVHLVENIPQKGSSAESNTITAVSENWAPIRISTSTLNLDVYDESMYCKDSKGRKKTLTGKVYRCKRDNIVTEEKKEALRRMIRQAIEMHSTRLKVQPIKGWFKVPTLTDPFCSRFTVPSSHRTVGVQGADLMLYLSFFVGDSYYHFAEGAPCAKLPSGRPVVGAITYDIEELRHTPYTVRVAAHEIAHVLGFSYKLMEKIDAVKPKKKDGVRKKPYVMEVQSNITVEKTREHFNCTEATGMELEDDDGPRQEASHSHWERRNAKDELMAGIVSRGHYTALTLAFFEDTGYYKADFTKAESMKWGANAGCNFLTDLCIKEGVSQFPNMFCTDSDTEVFYCLADDRSIGKCSGVTDYGIVLWSQYQYFMDKRVSGRGWYMTDWCPIVEEKKADECGNKYSDAPGFKSESSICVRKKKDSTVEINDNQDEALCARVTYDISKQAVKLQYGQSGPPEDCNEEHITLKSPFEGVEVVCPKYDEAEALAQYKFSGFSDTPKSTADTNPEDDEGPQLVPAPPQTLRNTDYNDGDENTKPFDKDPMSEEKPKPMWELEGARAAAGKPFASYASQTPTQTLRNTEYNDGDENTKHFNKDQTSEEKPQLMWEWRGPRASVGKPFAYYASQAPVQLEISSVGGSLHLAAYSVLGTALLFFMDVA